MVKREKMEQKWGSGERKVRSRLCKKEKPGTHSKGALGASRKTKTSQAEAVELGGGKKKNDWADGEFEGTLRGKKHN